MNEWINMYILYKKIMLNDVWVDGNTRTTSHDWLIGRACLASNHKNRFQQLTVWNVREKGPWINPSCVFIAWGHIYKTLRQASYKHITIQTHTRTLTQTFCDYKSWRRKHYFHFYYFSVIFYNTSLQTFQNPP